MEHNPNNGSLEQVYLAAIEHGDVQRIEHALRHQQIINVNTIDREGRNAIEIALESGHLEVVKLLLMYNVQVGDALLRAVDIQFSKAVELLCDHNKTLQKQDIDIINSHSSSEDFHPVITPIVLAAHHNNYDIIKILLSHGARIEDPDTYDATAKHTLQHSLGALQIYKALSSEAYMTLTSKDPINKAFALSHKLRIISQRDVEFSDEYCVLEERCQTFAADILAQTRSTAETNTILTYSPDDWEESGRIDNDTPHAVYKAVRYQQKKFVAHPNCQQFLIERWYRGLTNWRDRSQISKLIVSLAIMLFFPILSLIYIFVPRGRLVHFLRIPYVKFLMHTASSLGFITLIFLSLLRVEDWIMTGHFIESDEASEYSVVMDSRRGNKPTTIELIMCVWILGMTWREIKELWTHGVKDYTFDAWNIMDFFQLALYWTSYSLMLISWLLWRQRYSAAEDNGDIYRSKRLAVNELDEYLKLNTLPDLQSYVDKTMTNIVIQTTSYQTTMLTAILQTLMTNLSNACAANDNGHIESSISRILDKYADDNFITESRLVWDAFDPDLVAEGLFALANIISFIRLINVVIISKQVGPLQISLRGILYDIVKFLCIFSFILLAFTIGLTQLYKFYSTLTFLECSDHDDDPGCYQGFAGFFKTLRTLFWNLFGVINLKVLEVNANHAFTEGIGELLYALYHILGRIVLLNALIAMMSNTYTRIEENSDKEWKYSRAKLWMSYFENTGTIPPPFNVVPSIKTVYKLVLSVKYILCPRTRRRKEKKQLHKIGKLKKEYQEVVQQLVLRYWADRRPGGSEGDKNVTQSDIQRLKLDVSGFRHEMASNLQRNDTTLGVTKETNQAIIDRLLEVKSALIKLNKMRSEVQNVAGKFTESDQKTNAYLDFANCSRSRHQRLKKEYEYKEMSIWLDDEETEELTAVQLC
ncbi:short transient receptor potential channel 4-like [Glandiceps talaboti]